jgi:chromatin remodeling complex protein RSC6
MTPEVPQVDAQVDASSTTKDEQVDAGVAGFTELQSKLGAMPAALKEAATLVRSTHKEPAALKLLLPSKRGTKRRGDGEQKRARAPGGFNKPCVMSGEMCAFLGVAQGTQMSRTQATNGIHSYIKDHSLQESDNRRNIIVDGQLRTIMNPEGERLTYFNLQNKIKHNFAKTSAA